VLNATAGQHSGHGNHVGFVNRHCTAKVALVLGGLLGQDVTLEGLAALDGPPGRTRKRFFAPLLVFILGM
jgi:hypothetical protein